MSLFPVSLELLSVHWRCCTQEVPGDAFFQVQFVDESNLTLVNQKDFFLHTFDELREPDFGMFMFDDTETLVWFPPKVNAFIFWETASYLQRSLLNISMPYLWTFSLSK